MPSTVPNFQAKWNASIVSEYLKFEPSNPWRRSYFVWQPLILLFTSLSVPLCLVEPPLRPLVTVLWVTPWALRCLSNIQDSEGQSGARSLHVPHRLSPSNDQHYMPHVNYFPMIGEWFKNLLSRCRHLLVAQRRGQATSGQLYQQRWELWVYFPQMWRLQNFSFHSTCLTPWVWVAFFAEPDYFKSPTTVSLRTYTNKNASPPCFAFCLRFAASTSAGGRRDGVWRPWLNHNQTMNTNLCTPPNCPACLSPSLSLCIQIFLFIYFFSSDCTAAAPLEIIYDTVTRGTL